MIAFIAAILAAMPASPTPVQPPASAPLVEQQPLAAIPVRPTAKSDFESRLDEIDARAKKVATLRAKFVQRKHTPLLKKALESSGRVTTKGGNARWDTVAPRRSVMTTDPRGLQIFYPDQQVLEKYSLGGDLRGLVGSPLPTLGALRESFDISPGKASDLGGSDDDDSLLVIELLPKTVELKGHVARVRVLIDTRIPAARRIQFVDVDGERTEIEFKDVEVNKPVADAEVSQDMPPGTREVYPLGNPAAEASMPTEPLK